LVAAPQHLRLLAYSERAGLTRRDLEPAVSKAIRRRIVTRRRFTP